MTKVTTSKQLMEEYNSISSKAESFGKWLMKKKIKYKFHNAMKTGIISQNHHYDTYNERII
jgi:hypothetical protein